MNVPFGHGPDQWRQVSTPVEPCALPVHFLREQAGLTGLIDRRLNLT